MDESKFPQSRSPFFKRVSSITTLDFQDTVGFFHGFWISCSQRCLGFGWEMIGKNQTCLRDLPFAMATTLKFTKNKSVLSFHQGGKTNGRLSKNPWVISGCLSFAPRPKRKKKHSCLKAAALLSGPNSRNLGTSPQCKTTPKFASPVKSFSSWWSQPTHFKNMLVKLDHFPPGIRDENTKYLKPAPSFFLEPPVLKAHPKYRRALIQNVQSVHLQFLQCSCHPFPNVHKNTAFPSKLRVKLVRLKSSPSQT